MTEYVWAIDPGIIRCAWAFVPTTGSYRDADVIRTRTSMVRTVERQGARLGMLASSVRAAAIAQMDTYPPLCIWVEQPSGRFRNLTLVYAVGVVQAAAYEATGVPVWTIPSAKWKEATVGVGNASKADVAAWVRELVEVGTQDEADAVAIALAGRAKLLDGWDARVA